MDGIEEFEPLVLMHWMRLDEGFCFVIGVVPGHCDFDAPESPRLLLNASLVGGDGFKLA